MKIFYAEQTGPSKMERHHGHNPSNNHQKDSSAAKNPEPTVTKVRDSSKDDKVEDHQSVHEGSMQLEAEDDDITTPNRIDDENIAIAEGNSNPTQQSDPAGEDHSGVLDWNNNNGGLKSGLYHKAYKSEYSDYQFFTLSPAIG